MRRAGNVLGHLDADIPVSALLGDSDAPNGLRNVYLPAGVCRDGLSIDRLLRYEIRPSLSSLILLADSSMAIHFLSRTESSRVTPCIWESDTPSHGRSGS